MGFGLMGELIADERNRLLEHPSPETQISPRLPPLDGIDRSGRNPVTSPQSYFRLRSLGTPTEQMVFNRTGFF